MFKQLLTFAFSGLILATVAQASTIDTFTGSQNGLCCFNVALNQTNANSILVSVSLAGGATNFVNSGNGTNHPGFGFNFQNSSGGTVSISGITNGFTLASGSATVNGGGGTFNTFFNTPGNGGNAGVTSLSFTISDTLGLSFSNFISGGGTPNDIFVADIGINSNTGISGISNPGVITTIAATPEPSSLALMGTGVLGLAGFVRRKTAK